MKKLLLIIFYSIFIFSCGSNKNLTTKKPYVSPPLSEKESSQWDILCGKWYGKSDLEGNEKREWLVDRKNDGRYIIVFITIDQNGSRDKTIEEGEWGLSGDIYFTIFKSQTHEGEQTYADPSDPINRDSYKILKLNNSSFKYKHLRTHGIYEVTKVDPAFELN